jgi:hypothetical protein
MKHIVHFVFASLLVFGVFLSAGFWSYSSIMEAAASISGFDVRPLDRVWNYPLHGSGLSGIDETVTNFALPQVVIGNYVSAYAADQHLPEQFSPVMGDVNGDGILDMLYSYNWDRTWYQFVALGTGSGFTVVYSCKIEDNAATAGDCKR